MGCKGKSIGLSAKPFYLSKDEQVWVRSTLASMTQEEKIGQLFCLILRSEEDWRQKADDALRIAPAGIMLRPMEKGIAREAVSYLQTKSRIPLLVAANLERGGSGIVKEGTEYASNMAVAATRDVRFAEIQAMICAKEGVAVGANWAFAPVIDIDLNFHNPITNTRTYGSDPKLVADMAKAYVQTIQQHGMAACIKHFPGDGVDERDQHLVLSINDLDCERWGETYGMVYQECIEADALSVMAGHIMQPCFSRLLVPEIKEEEIKPGSLSTELIMGLLRERLHFNGLVVTDASTMAGFMQIVPRSTAVPLAIAAGCDVFLFTRNQNEDYEFMVKGLENGIITEARLDEAVTRILALKAVLGLPEKQRTGTLVPPQSALDDVGASSHAVLARECADHSITLVKNDGTLPVIDVAGKRVLLYVIGDEMAYGNIKGGKSLYFQKRLESEGFVVTRFNPSGGLEGSMKPYSDVPSTFDYIFYFCALATKSNQTTVRIEWSQPMGANCPIYIPTVPTIFISVENPYHLLDVPRVKTYINTYMNTEIVIDALVDKIIGKSPFKGRSPVDAFCGRWDTHL